MQAIQVKRLPCTEHRPTRFKATAYASSITISDPIEIPAEAAADGVVNGPDLAAWRLMCRLSWRGRWQVGALPNGDAVYVWTGACIEDDGRMIVR